MTADRIRELASKLEADWYDEAPSAADIEAALREVWNEAVEDCAKVCDGKVDWQPKFPQNVQRVSDETSHLLGKAIRSLKLPEGK